MAQGARSHGGPEEQGIGAEDLERILIVRLGAMGDILHALPAVAALRRARPEAEIAWVMEPKWMPLVSGCGVVDHLVPFQRRDWMSVGIARKWMRAFAPQVAVDFQGLIKSALIAKASGAERRIGLSTELLRERVAGVLYTEYGGVGAEHVVEQNVALARRVGVGEDFASEVSVATGSDEGTLPEEPFVLACPYAGWKSKQWPAENYAAVAERLVERGMRLVLNVAPGQETPEAKGIWRHESSLSGLIGVTRRARAVLGLDSGPMHLAAVLGKPGVALFGPTSPERNGPYSKKIVTLRAEGAPTSYKRDNEISPSMRALSVERVWRALEEKLD